MAGKKGQKKRFWSDDEERSICGQARSPGVSVAQVRRYSMNASLISKWLKDPRFSPASDVMPSCLEGGSVFLPVEVSGPATDPRTDEMTMGSARSVSAPLLAQRIDITLSDGRRVVADGPTALPAVVGLVQGLMA